MARKSASQPKSNEILPTDKASPKLAVDKMEEQQRDASQTRETTNMTDISIIEYSDDLGNAEAPVPLPIGDYPAEIRGAVIKTSGKGNQYVEVQLYISPESYPADYTDGSEDGAILTYGRLSPDDTQRARYGMRKFAEAIGAPTGKKVDMNEWLGLNAIVTVAHDTYEGETRAQIKKVNPA